MNKRIVDILALAAALATIWGYSKYSEARIAAIPISDWFEVRGINVADFTVGATQRPVIYDRTVHKAFTGVWTAKVHRVTDDFNLCFGSGTARYTPKDTVPVTGVTLDWFVGTHCELPPGQYVIEASYTITTDEGAIKHLQATSNIFNVTEKK